MTKEGTEIMLTDRTPRIRSVTVPWWITARQPSAMPKTSAHPSDTRPRISVCGKASRMTSSTGRFDHTSIPRSPVTALRKKLRIWTCTRLVEAHALDQHAP